MFLGACGIKLIQLREHNMIVGTMQIVGGDNSESGSSSYSEKQKQEEGMDGLLWSKLPQHLLLSILARLPLESLAQLKQVCRDWKSLCQDRAFLHLRSQADAASSNSWFIFSKWEWEWERNTNLLPNMTIGRNNTLIIKRRRPDVTLDCYNTHSNKWHKLRFDRLPPIDHIWAASGGLLLYTNNYETPSGYRFLDIIICNPLKPNSWERITKRFGEGFGRTIKHIGMVAEPHTGNYKVMLTTDEETEIYDSREISWKSFRSILSQSHDISSSLLEYRGRLLFLGVGRINQLGTMFVYNLEHNTCSSYENLRDPHLWYGSRYCWDPHPWYGFRYGFLENCGGRLLVVRIINVRQVHDEQNYEFEVQVSEYLHTADDLSDGVWRELTSIPRLELQRSMLVNSKEGANFLAGAVASSSSSSGALSSSYQNDVYQNDLLCFTIGMKDGKLDCFNHVQEGAVFLYSVSQNLWCFVRILPEFWPDWASDVPNFRRSLMFQPSLHASMVPY